MHPFSVFSAREQNYPSCMSPCIELNTLLILVCSSYYYYYYIFGNLLVCQGGEKLT